MQQRCPLCSSSKTDVLFQSKLKWAVRSDWTPLPVAAEVFHCSECSLVFKDPALVRKWSDYQDYAFMQNDSDRDKLDFSKGIPTGRSQALIDHAKKSGIFTDDSSVLDYGCNRGAFLKLLGNSKNAGFDVAPHYRANVEKLGCRYFTPDSPPPRGEFDAMSLVHVFEHLPDPSRSLENGINALKPNGKIIIQVPDAFTQPTDLYVMDHFMHYTRRSLDLALSKTGFQRIGPNEPVLPGELTGYYSRTENENGGVAPTQKNPAELSAMLVDAEALLIDLQKSKKPLYIYGAGMFGMMIEKLFPEQAIAFLDDNPSMHSAPMAGKAVLNPKTASLDKNAAILLAVPPAATAKVKAACEASGNAVYAPYVPVH